MIRQEQSRVPPAQRHPGCVTLEVKICDLGSAMELTEAVRTRRKLTKTKRDDIFHIFSYIFNF